jgi:prolyl 4-hydroxylase
MDHEPLCVDAFLPAAWCAWALDELEITHWQPSTVVSPGAAGGLETRRSRCRLSQTAHQQWFSPELTGELRRIEARLARLLGCRRGQFEPWQVTRYRRGGRFEDHYDAGSWSADPAGDRQYTVLIYLNDAAGGATRFRRLALEVPARAGRLLAWRNLLPNGERDERMLHAGTAVRRGVKNVLVTWVRQRELAPREESEKPWPKKRPSSPRSPRSTATSSTSKRTPRS